MKKIVRKEGDAGRITHFFAIFSQIEQLVLGNIHSSEMLHGVMKALGSVRVRKLEIRSLFWDEAMQYVQSFR